MGRLSPRRGRAEGAPWRCTAALSGLSQPSCLTHLGSALMKFSGERSERGDLFRALDAILSFSMGVIILSP